MSDGRSDEGLEQGVDLRRTRAELGMELRAQEERVVLDLEDLDERAVRRETREHDPLLPEAVAVLVVELVAVPVPLLDLDRAVGLVSLAALLERARVEAEAHGPALLVDLLLLLEERDHRVRRARVELRRVGPR